MEPRLAGTFFAPDDLAFPVAVFFEEGALILCFVFAVMDAIFFLTNMIKLRDAELVLDKEGRFDNENANDFQCTTAPGNRQRVMVD